MDGKQPVIEQPERGEDVPTQEANVMTTPTQIAAGGSSSSPYPRGPLNPNPNIHQYQLQRQLNNFWETQLQESENTVEFNHTLPLARIKKVMKADENVRMVAAEAPVLFSKACEMFITELTMRAWANADENKRRTLMKSDIASAIGKTDVFDFLVDTVPRDATMEHEVYVGIPPRENAAGFVQNVPPPPLGIPHPYYHMPPPPPQFGAGMPPRMILPGPPFDHPIYRQQPPYPYGQVPQYPVPNHPMMKNYPDSDDQAKN